MTSRERRMSMILLVLLGVGGIGFFSYQLILVPLRNRDNLIASLNDEIETKMNRIATIQKRKPDLELWRKISLPQDAGLARREYEEELSKLMRASGFEASAFSIIPKPIDARTSPTLANKKPIYTRLNFTVTAKGDLATLVDMLQRFYKLRLLHQIRNITILRPIDSERRSTSNELDITLSIEALVLDTAENRKVLVPDKSVTAPPLLAKANRKYDTIPGKNMFYGPPPPPPESPKPPPTVDVTPFVKLDSITHSEGVVTAALYDSYHNHDFQIRPRTLGGFRVEVSYYLSNRKRPLRSGKAIELMDDQGEVDMAWDVIKIEDREVILRDEDGKYFALHIGQTLADMTPLSKEQLAALGIKVDPPKDAKPAANPTSRDVPPSKEGDAKTPAAPPAKEGAPPVQDARSARETDPASQAAPPAKDAKNEPEGKDAKKPPELEKGR